MRRRGTLDKWNILQNIIFLHFPWKYRILQDEEYLHKCYINKYFNRLCVSSRFTLD